MWVTVTTSLLYNEDVDHRRQFLSVYFWKHPNSILTRGQISRMMDDWCAQFHISEIVLLLNMKVHKIVCPSTGTTKYIVLATDIL